jgi:hypothetical protein
MCVLKSTAVFAAMEEVYTSFVLYKNFLVKDFYGKRAGDSFYK